MPLPGLLAKPALNSHRDSIGATYYEIAECGSTNDLVQQLAQQGHPNGTLVRALQQTQGRGRQGSSWFSHPAALQFSYLLRPSQQVAELPFLNIITSHALHKVLYRRTKIPIMLKWPNDLMVGHKKLAGVMSNMRSSQDGVQYVVVGCGLNLNLQAADFPQELRSQATSVQMETHQSVDAVELLQDFVVECDQLYQRYQLNCSPITCSKA